MLTQNLEKFYSIFNSLFGFGFLGNIGFYGGSNINLNMNNYFFIEEDYNKVKKVFYSNSKKYICSKL